MMKAEVAKTFVELFDDAIQSSYSDLIDRLKSALYNIVEHVLKEVSVPSEVAYLTKLSWPSFTMYECTSHTLGTESQSNHQCRHVESEVCRTNVYIVQNLVDKCFDD